jgi:enoyl-CoA hydratase/carnithine racemase
MQAEAQGGGIQPPTREGDSPREVTDDVVVSLDAPTHVGTIEMNRPPHNYFNGDALARVIDATWELHARGARALVLCSAGRNFCAGANFDPGAAVAGGRNDVYELGIQLLEQPLPIVVAIQGGVIGGGVGLALVGDIRVAATDSWFWINFARLGIHHGFGLSVTLPLAVGQQAAIELLYTGRRVDGATAHALGLCDHLVAADQVRPRAHALAREIAAAAPLATQAIRKTMRGSIVDAVKTAMSKEGVIQERLVATSDFREGVAAVRERREPSFDGR